MNNNIGNNNSNNVYHASQSPQETSPAKKEESKKVSTAKSGALGTVLGGVAGALGTAMANPVGRWAIFTSQDEWGRGLNRFVFDLTHNADLSFGVHKVFDNITNAVMAYPAILPIAGGILAGTAGAVVGRIVSKARLKHKSLKPKNLASGKKM